MATSEKELALLDAVEAMRELTLAANQMIYFPVSVGISSMVFRKQKAMYFNNFNRVNNIHFVNEIDNVKSLEKIDNLLVCHTTRDDGTSNGIIQLYYHGTPITEMHKKQLKKKLRRKDTTSRDMPDTAIAGGLNVSSQAIRRCLRLWMRF